MPIVHKHDWHDWRLGSQVCMHDETVNGKVVYCTAMRMRRESGFGYRDLTDDEREAIDDEIKDATTR